MRRIVNNIEVNIPEPQEVKVFWTKSKKVILVAFVATVTSWIPFHGYMYLNALLSGIGFESVYVSISVWEAVYYFLISINDIWQHLPDFNTDYTIKVAVISSILFVLLITYFYCIDCMERLGSKAIEKLEEFRTNRFYKLVWSIAAALASGVLIFLLPILLVLIPALVFLFSVLGNTYGMTDGRNIMVDKKCIYAAAGSECVSVDINKVNRPGYVVYANNTHTFFVANDGLYYLNSKGRVLQHRPFIPSLKKYAEKGTSFDPKIWQNKVSLRWSLLEGFIENPEYELTRDIVLKNLGQSDSFFHYEKIPAYKLSKNKLSENKLSENKLSENKFCSVAFPYDLVTKNVVNVVLYGDCKGVISK